MAHEGGSASGEYLQRLDVTDVFTGWTEVRAVCNKAQVWVMEAMEVLERRTPHPWLGLASDNGAEFIIQHLLRFWEDCHITFTRTRAYRKNDDPHVEQKNYSVVCRAVGYDRFDREQELEVFNKLNEALLLQINLFKLVMKLVQTGRIGRRIVKKYDWPKTPYQSVLDSPQVSTKRERQLRQQYETLNPVELSRQMARHGRLEFDISDKGREVEFGLLVSRAKMMT